MSASPDAKIAEAAPAAGAFDSHHAPSGELIDDCVHCGFCLPTCPTYALWGQEMDSPRGRIYLMKLGREGKTEMSGTFVSHFDRCLGCMACMTACPSGVQYEKLIEATRSQIERRYPRSLADGFFRWLLFRTFPYPERVRLLLMPLWIYQKSGLQWLLRRSGLLKILPSRLQSLESLAPKISSSVMNSDLPVRVSARGTPRRRVGMLLGCVQRVFFADVNAATARVLAAEGCEVVIPPEQECCGALMVHAGLEEEAARRARRLIDVFEESDVETIVINAAGCGSSMKEYAHLLRDDTAYAERARAFAAKCKDVAEILAELSPRAERRPLALRVAYHDACHLQHAQAVRSQPRKILAGIPGLQVLEVPDAALCCGSAGIYNLVEPQAALELGDRKVRNVLTTGAEVVVSGNPGCLLQISAGFERAGRKIPIRHTVELLDASIRGVGAEAFLQGK